MIHIDFGDPVPEEMVLNHLAGWVVGVNGTTDIFVTGTDTDAFGYRRLVGLPVDDEGTPTGEDEVAFRADGITIVIY